MKQIRKIYLVGLGAVGAAYAGMLQDTDPGCVSVVAGSERIKRYRESGFKLNGKPYSFTYISPEEDAPPADLILIAVKHHQLAQAIKDIKNFVGRETIILSLLNGIVSEEVVAGEYGMDRLLYSFCVGIDAVRTGTEVEYSNSGRIVFGEKTNPTHSPKVSAVRELFERAHIPYSIPVDMMRELWWKFMINVGINQVSAVLGAPYGVFQKVAEARELLEAAATEVVEISKKAGISLEKKDIEEFIKMQYTLSPNGKTSMLQDVEAGRKTEVEIFAGTVIELGLKYEVPTPVNHTLFRMIRTLEQSYR